MIRRLSPLDAFPRRWTTLVLPAALAVTGAVVPVAPAAGSSRSLPTISTTTVRTAPLVRLGDRGNSVALVQQALMSQGIALRGGADGVFGPITLAAVKTFQTQKGLSPTGEVNETTAHLLGLGPVPALPERGQRSDLVRALQQALIDASIAVRGGADGFFGPATAAAVQAFQAGRGLPTTGVVDLPTGIALGIVPGASNATQAPAGQASSISFTASAYLTPGQAGDAVKAMQSALIAAGVSVRGGADGRYGPATSQAVAAYQSNMRLPATGTVDTLTAQLLGLVAGPALPKLGEKSANVASLQQLLINIGIPVRGGADGSFGPITQAAVIAFQRSQSLPADGVVDLRTGLFLGLIPGATPPGRVDGTTPPATTPPATPPTTNPLQVFPVLGPCYFTDTWGAPRSGGRRHEGVDIIAATGTPVYAVTAGTITRQFFDQVGSLGGNALRLTAPDGTYYFYAHFASFAEGIKVGSVVKAGQVIGYVGATGNTGTAHLHFEYHPGGGAAVNPFPFTKAIDRCKVTTPPEIIG
ncbi:MAG: peptidoglycan-binding protein [Actinomycetota bacterium]